MIFSQLSIQQQYWTNAPLEFTIKQQQAKQWLPDVWRHILLLCLFFACFHTLSYLLDLHHMSTWSISFSGWRVLVCFTHLETDLVINFTCFLIIEVSNFPPQDQVWNATEGWNKTPEPPWLGFVHEQPKPHCTWWPTNTPSPAQLQEQLHPSEICQIYCYVLKGSKQRW